MSRLMRLWYFSFSINSFFKCERGGSVVECQTPEREVGGSIPTTAVLCLWARHFTPWKYWLITQEAVAPSRHDWKIVDWDVKPQHKQTKQMRCAAQPSSGAGCLIFGWPFVYFHTSCVRTSKPLVRLGRCEGLPEPLQVAYVISTIISWAGSNILNCLFRKRNKIPPPCR